MTTTMCKINVAMFSDDEVSNGFMLLPTELLKQIDEQMNNIVIAATDIGYFARSYNDDQPYLFTKSLKEMVMLLRRYYEEAIFANYDKRINAQTKRQTKNQKRNKKKKTE